MPYHQLKYSLSRSKRRKKNKSHKKRAYLTKDKNGGIKEHVNGPIAEKG
jgi:hypothetical protein